MNHLLKLSDLTKEELLGLLETGHDLKKKLKEGIETPYLKGKTLGMIFQKASTRTRVSFEVGMNQLGGKPLYLSVNDLQMGRGEPIEDTARVLSRYLDAIMIRTYEQSDVEALAEYGTIPIINGLTDLYHPCQILADLMTIQEVKGELEGLKFAFVGDGNNMANSLIVGALLAGASISVASPEGYQPDASILEEFASHPKFTLTENPYEAVKDADVVFTDVWASMGDEAEADKRKQIFQDLYQVNSQLLSVAHPEVMVQHCLPAHKEEEITTEIFEQHAHYIFEEAENRLHVQKAVLVHLLGVPAYAS
ncbi:ornithine carbamoyltransferase [Alkalibacterium olivapovliticus]|uniref:Ornithine carbamoyltransferase n=1 Tax=Alkalibacterium olivapovliticus TaxID=99907 RepID=A0A2T0W7A5_9LACT|nr:ornithine carbamoyltransferase [Alkalibacterium olivapovliticus]PRY82590.1 ornithine carbamoyltransferase [Alkalibacterium olivapovliticus]